MRYSDVEIVNVALAALGKAALRGFGVDVEDTSTSRLARRAYDISKDSLLTKHDWSFARTTVQLNALSDTHPEGTLYALPSNCLVPRKVKPRLSLPNKYTVEGRNILIPTAFVVEGGEVVYLTYTADVTETGVFPGYFVHALAMAIAVFLCMPLTADEDHRKTLVGEAGFLLAEAKLHDSHVDREDTQAEQDPWNDTFVDPDAGATIFNG